MIGARENVTAAAGLTLVELVVALALASFVALAGLAALESLGQQGRAIDDEASGEAVARRGLARLEQDLELAREARLEGARLLVELADGSFAGYALSPSRTQLHRVVAADESSARAALDTLALDALRVEPLLERGLLQDGAYRESALLLGMRAIEWRLEEREVAWPRRGVRLGKERLFAFRGFDAASLASAGARVEELALALREPISLGALAPGLAAPWCGLRFRAPESFGRICAARLYARRVPGNATGALELRIARADRPERELATATVEAAALAALGASWSTLEVPLSGALDAGQEHVLLVSSSGGAGGVELRAEIVREGSGLAPWRLDDGLAFVYGIDLRPSALQVQASARLAAELEQEREMRAPLLGRRPLALLVRVAWSERGAFTARLPLARAIDEVLRLERDAHGVPSALPSTREGALPR